MGVEVAVHELTKSFGRQTIWGDVTLTLPPGEVSALLGPSGTGKSVFLKALIGLLKPDKGSIIIRDVDIARCSESKLYETRKLFGVLFQDGALFGSMTLYDNVAFPLREHTEEVRDRDPLHRAWRRWTWSGSPARRRSCPARSPAVCASAPAWPARWC